MAENWIKMRTSLQTHPKVISVAQKMAQRDAQRDAQHSVTAAQRNVTRFAVIGALCVVWGNARMRGEKRGEDLAVDGVTLDFIDDTLVWPGFGEALQSVGWAVQNTEGVVFPGFFVEHNAEVTNKKKSAAAAERQARYRERQREKAAGDAQRNALRDAQQPAQRDAQRDDRERERERDCISIPDAVAGTESQMHTNGQMLSLLTETHESHSPEVAAAAADWNRHLQEKAFDKIPEPGTVHHEKFWGLLSDWGPKRFVAAIEYTIRNGWLNVREEPKRAKGGTRQAVLDTDPDFLRAVEVCREFPSASDYDREQREAKLGPDVMRLVRKISSARLAECNDFNRKALAAEWTINRSSMR